jgi:hypothetical protein
MTLSIRVGVMALALAALATSGTVHTQRRGPRTFAQFVGTWTLDEAASTGRLNIVPRVPLTLTITTTPTEITVTKRPRLGPADRASASPPPEVYRLDGAETQPTDARTGVPLERTYRFTLVADMLALTIKETREGAATLVTDAYAVEGDVLTLHRQLSSVSAAGTIATMSEPTNNFRHTFVYRRIP